MLRINKTGQVVSTYGGHMYRLQIGIKNTEDLLFSSKMIYQVR